MTTTTTTTKKLVPILVQEHAKNPIFFPAILVGLHAVFIILLAFHADYGHEPAPVGSHLALPPDSIIMFPNRTQIRVGSEGHGAGSAHRGIADFYSMFQDIHVMIFVGFGFLMTFLKRYG